ncbi:MAG TPA: hypothetical protein VHX42_03055 [Candidatus Babeliales bacterium]|jgi:hypothetical protein|nr:hypothetical protein [Candidatus Babeliales bacterium]
MDIKNVLIVLMIVGATSAMEHQLDLQNKEISFKSLCGFPLINIRNGKSWFSTLSEHKKNKVHKVIRDHNNANLLMFFTIATKLLPELQNRLVLELFNNNGNAAHKFLNRPIVDVLENYVWSQESRRTYCFDSTWFTSDSRFEYSKEFMVLNKLHHRVCSKNELQSLVILQKRFVDLRHQLEGLSISYQFYELSFNKFKQQFSKKQLIVLFFMLARYINVTFPAPFDEVFDSDIVELNQAAEQYNVVVNRLQHQKWKLSDLVFEKGRELSILDPYSIVPNRFFAIKLLSCISGMFLFCIYFNDHILNQKATIDELLIHKSYLLSTVSLYGFYKLIHFVGSQCEPGSSWGVGCMAGLYALICSGYNAMKTYSWHESVVRFNKISELLERTDIVIK